MKCAGCHKPKKLYEFLLNGFDKSKLHFFLKSYI